MDPNLLKAALGGVAVLGCIGLLFGIGLAMAAQKFAVAPDHKVEEVLEVLAGAQCGGCGFPGCEAYAEAVVHDPNVPANKCFPGKAAVAEQVAKLTGKEAAAPEPVAAVVHCARVPGNVERKYNYVGYNTCHAANLAFAGPMNCQYACEGFGDCARACMFDAIKMHGDFPVIDPNKCVACGACVAICPKNIIKFVPKDARIIIPCSTKDPGKTTMEICDAGCIHDRACVRKCPGAISEIDGIIRVDHGKCNALGPQCEEVCLPTCKKRHIIWPYSLSETHLRLAQRLPKAPAEPLIPVAEEAARGEASPPA